MADRYDIVIIGMGSGGMVAAEFAASLDLSVAVVERDRVGGDCLWTGCVPSKALLASARAAHTLRHATEFGLGAVDVRVDLPAVWQRIRRIRTEIATTDDDPARFTELGVELVRGTGRVAAPDRVAVTDDSGTTRHLDTRFVLICTGSRPRVPAVEGLGEVDFLTSESIFELIEPPSSIVFLGGGPIASELAQGCARLGIAATLVQRGAHILPRDEPELARIVQDALEADGVDVHTNADAHRVTQDPVTGGVIVHGRASGRDREWPADAVFVAAGRTPNVEGLGLDEAGVDVNDRGICVDARMRSTVPSIYAAGDVAGRYLFTHSAGYEAVRAVRDMFFPGKGKADSLIPWCTFTEPELAHAGMTVAEAEAAHGDSVQVYRQDLIHNDRARADGQPNGAIVVVCAKDRVVGAHIAAPVAGEMIHELAMAVAQGAKFSSIGSFVHVYPTLSMGIFQLAGEASFEKASKYRWLIRH